MQPGFEDDIKYYAKYAGLWLTKRGIGAAASLLATAGMGLTYLVPLVTLPASLFLTNYLVKDQAEYMRVRMRNAYRREIGAVVGKDPDEVTNDDLVTVALGDEASGIPGNSVLAEQMGRVSSHSRLSIISSVLAVGIALVGILAISGGVGDGFFEPIKAFAAEYLPVVKNHAVFAAGVVAGTLSLVSDFLIHHTGLKLLGLDKPSTFECIHQMERELRRGKAISQEEVMDVFAMHNPVVAGQVYAAFHRPFHELSAPEKQQVVQTFGEHFHIAELTQKINEGRVRTLELAFLVEGRASGVPESEPHERSHIHFFLPGITKEAEQEKTAEPERQMPPIASHVERYLTSVKAVAPKPESLGFADRVRSGDEIIPAR